MKQLDKSQIEKYFLILTAFGLTPLALMYGAVPELSLGLLFDITDMNVNAKHIYRALMGLYLGMIVLWALGAFNLKFREAALYSLVFFMFGLAGGRIISILIDGFPNWILSLNLALELVMGLVGLEFISIRKTSKKNI